MSQFTEAFIFRAEGADHTKRGVREDDLARTLFVPASDNTTAGAAAAELLDEGLDLVELYGGFGPRAAAAVVTATDGKVPVGLVGVEQDDPARDGAVIYVAAGAEPDRDRFVYEHSGRRMTFVAAPDTAAVPRVAAELVAAGAETIELAGGLGAVPAAAVIAAVGERALIAPIMFGFESLPGAAAFRARYEAAAAAA